MVSLLLELLTVVSWYVAVHQRSVSQRQQLTSMLKQLSREETDFLKLLHHTLVKHTHFLCLASLL